MEKFTGLVIAPKHPLHGKGLTHTSSIYVYNYLKEMEPISWQRQFPNVSYVNRNYQVKRLIWTEAIRTSRFDVNLWLPEEHAEDRDWAMEQFLIHYYRSALTGEIKPEANDDLIQLESREDYNLRVHGLREEDIE